MNRPTPRQNDRAAFLAYLLNHSLEQCERDDDRGLIPAHWHSRYVRLWTWSAARFGGEPDRQQQRFYERHGRSAYDRRINRVRVALGFKPL